MRGCGGGALYGVMPTFKYSHNGPGLGPGLMMIFMASPHYCRAVKAITPNIVIMIIMTACDIVNCEILYHIVS